MGRGRVVHFKRFSRGISSELSSGKHGYHGHFLPWASDIWTGCLYSYIISHRELRKSQKPSFRNECHGSSDFTP